MEKGLVNGPGLRDAILPGVAFKRASGQRLERGKTQPRASASYLTGTTLMLLYGEPLMSFVLTTV
jgi:hypothetical protein